MRLDFTLYGLAIVLFLVAVAAFFVFSENEFQIIFTLSATLLGLVCVTTGYFVRPKLQKTPQMQTTVSTQPQTQPEETPKAEASTEAEKPKNEVPITITESPVEKQLPPEEPKMLAGKTTNETPVLSAPEPEPQLSPPVEVLALTAPAPNVTSDLTQIRGINSARAEQLKAYGIGSISELARASPEELAAKLSVSPKIVKMWVGSAKKKTI